MSMVYLNSNISLWLLMICPDIAKFTIKSFIAGSDTFSNEDIDTCICKSMIQRQLMQVKLKSMLSISFLISKSPLCACLDKTVFFYFLQGKKF